VSSLEPIPAGRPLVPGNLVVTAESAPVGCHPRTGDAPPFNDDDVPDNPFLGGGPTAATQMAQEGAAAVEEPVRVRKGLQRPPRSQNRTMITSS
jgi:hypothetical protein